MREKPAQSACIHTRRCRVVTKPVQCMQKQASRSRHLGPLVMCPQPARRRGRRGQAAAKTCIWRPAWTSWTQGTARMHAVTTLGAGAMTTGGLPLTPAAVTAAWRSVASFTKATWRWTLPLTLRGRCECCSPDACVARACLGQMSAGADAHATHVARCLHGRGTSRARARRCLSRRVSAGDVVCAGSPLLRHGRRVQGSSRKDVLRDLAWLLHPQRPGAALSWARPECWRYGAAPGATKEAAAKPARCAL